MTISVLNIYQDRQLSRTRQLKKRRRAESTSERALGTMLRSAMDDIDDLMAHAGELERLLEAYREEEF